MRNPSPPDDISLIAQIAQSQPEAVGRLYDQYNRLVFSVAFAVVETGPMSRPIVAKHGFQQLTTVYDYELNVN